jgi:mono/diheme cytochrome c family protein
MKQTIQDSLSHLKDDDLHAIAVYLKSAPTDTNAPPADVADTVKTPGAEAYLTHCAYCHLPDGHGRKGAISSLAGNGAVDAGGPEDVIRIVLGGLPASHGLGPMPAVGVGLDDQKIADIVNFVRQSWGNHAPANADGAMVAKLRAETKTVMALNLAGGCKTVDDPALAKAVAQPAIKNALSDRKRPLLDRIDAIVPKVKAAAPGATNDAIVNALSDAYCPVVMADTSASAADRIEDFGTFSGLVYGRLAGRPDRS